jgi:D-lyxose ketol-isomerase
MECRAHEETENTDVTVTVDGCRQTHAPGSQLRLTPGKASA